MQANLLLKADDLARLLSVARAAAASVDDLFFEVSRSPVAVVKGDKDFATEADMAAHTRLIALLGAAIPGVPVLSEEAAEAERSQIAQQDLYWVIDPIDGTINFASGSPLCGLTIALMHKGQAVLGVLRFPRLREEYWALSGKGAYFNEKRIELGGDKTLGRPEDNIICHGALPSPEASVTQAELARSFLSTQSIGSAALALAWAARGVYGGCLFRSNNAWDMQAGVLLIREAGGEAWDWRGESHNVGSKTMLAGSSQSVAEVLRVFKGNAPVAARDTPRV